MGMNQWTQARTPTPPTGLPTFMSVSGRKINITFIDQVGRPIRVKAEPMANLAVTPLN